MRWLIVCDKGSAASCTQLDNMRLS